MTLDRFRRFAVLAGSFLALIMFTGAAVRLTDSGLGCDDWPKCNDERLIPELGFHEWIEFGNRLLSGAVSFAVLALIWAARRLVVDQPSRHADRALRWSWGLIAVVVAQIVLGGITVLVDLHPVFVSVHYLLSIVTVTQAVVIWHFATMADRPEPSALDDGTPPTHDRWRVVGVAFVVLVLGTVVTGTGPNSGDIEAERLALDLEWVSRIHSVSAWILVATIAASAVSAVRAGLDLTPTRRLVAATVIQGAIGYWQYGTGVPPLLVELHVIGSVAVWFFALRNALAPAEANGVGRVDEVAPGPMDLEVV